MRTTKHFLNFSSSQKQSGTDYDFLINFNSTALVSSGATNEAVRTYISPQQIVIPASWDNIRSGVNDKVIINIALNSASPVDVSFNLPVGSPDINTLANTLKTNLQTSVPTFYYSGSTHNITAWDVSYNSYKQRLSISATVQNSHPISYTWKFGSSNTASAGALLGFGVADYTITNLASGSAYNPPFIPDVQPYQMIKIKSNIAKRSYDIRNSVLGASQDFATIMVGNTLVGSNVVFQPTSNDDYKQLIDNNFSSISILLTDRNNNPITSLSGDSFYTFIIEREYEEVDTINRKQQTLREINSQF